MLDGIASRFIVLWGWRRLLVAFVAGLLAALALPPFNLFPVLLLSLPVLVWLIDGTTPGLRWGRLAAIGAAAGVGWAFGFGYFLLGLYWVGAAFLVEADIFGWMMPFAVVALPAGLAVFTAAGMAIARSLWGSGPRRIFAFAVGLTLSELLRGHALTGFGWNTLGYALTATPVLMQVASLLGVYGLTLLAALIFASPAALSGAGSRRARLAVPLLGAALFVAVVGYGAARLADSEMGTVEDFNLRIVQPSIAQETKWLPENRSPIFTTYLELSDTAASPDAMGIGDIDLLVWPESALPFVFDYEPEALRAIAALLPQRTTLVTGIQRIEMDDTDRRGYRVYNSIKAIDHRGRIGAVYDKVRLVPFGEFLPFQDTLETIGLQQLTRVAGGFSPGRQRTPIRAGSAPRFQPLICYEVIFPGAVISSDDRPDFMLNVTNDGWFGDSPGPWQHLRQARLRAVEEGLPVVRAANTGISAVIDAYGRVTHSLGLGGRGVIDAGLPKPLEPTVFARWGHWPLAIIMSFCAIIALRNEWR